MVGLLVTAALGALAVETHVGGDADGDDGGDGGDDLRAVVEALEPAVALAHLEDAVAVHAAGDAVDDGHAAKVVAALAVAALSGGVHLPRRHVGHHLGVGLDVAPLPVQSQLPRHGSQRHVSF